MSLHKDIVKDEDTIRDECIEGFPPKEFDEEFVHKICRNCTHLHVDMVGHPGGSTIHSVEKKACMIGYWKDDF